MCWAERGARNGKFHSSVDLGKTRLPHILVFTTAVVVLRLESVVSVATTLQQSIVAKKLWTREKVWF